MDLHHSSYWFGILVIFEVYVSAEVVITSVNASIAENDPVTLTCTLTGTTETAKSFSWFVKRKLEKSSRTVGYLTSTCESAIVTIDASLYEYACPNSRQSTWTINKVTRQDHGDRYQCNIETPSRNQNSGFTFLIVQVSIASVSMTVPNTSVVTVREDTEEVFKCKTSGGRPAANVTWYKNSGTPGVFSDDVEVTSSIDVSYSTTNDLIEVTSTMRYAPSRNETGWRIYCSARNSYGMSSIFSGRKPLLNVHYPPVIGELKNRTVVEGSPMTVSCPVIVGNPPETTFEWERNGIIWKKAQAFTISAASRNDAMVYTCKVANEMHQPGEQSTSLSDTSSFYLSVLYNTSVSSFFIEGHRGQSNVVVDELDEDIQFICTVESNPASNVKIMFEGNILKEKSNTKYVSFERSQVECLHSGVYSCEGSNSYGQSSSKKLTLLVKCSPRPNYQTEQTITGSIHAPVTLSFTALANPEPGPRGFSWHKENDKEWTPLLNNADVHITSSAYQSNLTILDLSETDFGRYWLTVTNSIGVFVQYFFLSEKGSMNASICKCEKDITGVVLGVTLGLVCAVLAVYAASLTIIYKRKTASKETQSTNKSPKQTTYANLSFKLDVTESQGTRYDPKGNNTGDINEVEDDTTRQYTDLVRHSKDDRTTYDIIHPNE